MGAPDRELWFELFLIATEMATQSINLFVVFYGTRSCLRFSFGGWGWKGGGISRRETGC